MKNIFAILLLIPFSLLAQKQAEDFYAVRQPIDLLHCEASYQQAQLNSSEELDVMNYLNSFHPEIELRLLHTTYSKTGVHHLFQQYYQGIPIYRGQIKVNLNKTGKILSRFENSFPIDSEKEYQFPEKTIAREILRGEKGIIQEEVQATLFYNGTHLLPALQVKVWKENSECKEWIINQEGSIIYHHDLNSYLHTGVDSTKTLYVFNPDPVTSAGVSYGGNYKDHSDTDIAELNAERVPLPLEVDLDNDTFRLVSQYVIIKEFSGPTTTPAYVTTTDFDFGRADTSFEDVNAFYHISKYQEYIQSLGINNLVNYQIWVDAHALNGGDNSMFSPNFAPPRLLFGQGGVDDAEDADVIVHEYGHAISHSAAPNTNTGVERQAIDEGFGDFVAAGYSRTINPFQWENIFSWDGHNEYWAGRTAASNKSYPDDLAVNRYKDADVWSSPLMEIWGDLGPDITNEIVFESMYSYATNMTMEDAAHLLILADSSLFNGQYHGTLCYRLANRGFIKGCEDELGLETILEQEDLKISYQQEHFVISHFQEQVRNISLFNLNGQLLQEIVVNTTNNIRIPAKGLVPGIYLLQINDHYYKVAKH